MLYLSASGSMKTGNRNGRNDDFMDAETPLVDKQITGVVTVVTTDMVDSGLSVHSIIHSVHL